MSIKQAYFDSFVSYRRMLILATNIKAAKTYPPKVRRAAIKVEKLLGPVINDAIAPAALLEKAREAFLHLLEVVDPFYQGQTSTIYEPTLFCSAVRTDESAQYNFVTQISPTSWKRIE